MVNWYIRFLSDRKQRLVYSRTVCDWMMISKGTMQGSVSRPHLFNLFLDDRKPTATSTMYRWLSTRTAIPLYWSP